MNGQYTLYDFINEVDEEKTAGLSQAVAGTALKSINPLMTVKSVSDTAKQRSAQNAIKQDHANNLMGVSGKFNKVAFSIRKKKSDKDKKYGNLYKKKNRRLNSAERALIAGGVTTAGLGLYGAAKHKDPLWAARVVNRNKGVAASKTMSKLIKHSPFRDVAREASRAVHDTYGTSSPKENTGSLSNRADDMIRGGNAKNLAGVFGLSMAMAAGKNTGDLVYNRFMDQVKAKKLEVAKEEQRQADAVSEKLKAEDLFKKASISTGDDIVTAVNKSVEKFLPEEIRKREARRNRYNSTVDYVDHGAHGGDAPQRRNK